jgi:hypothetical protein
MLTFEITLGEIKGTNQPMSIVTSNNNSGRVRFKGHISTISGNYSERPDVFEHTKVISF